MVANFANFKAGYSGSLFAQGTELEAISRGNLTMSIAVQELAQFFPEFSILLRAMCTKMRRTGFGFLMIH